MEAPRGALVMMVLSKGSKVNLDTHIGIGSRVGKVTRQAVDDLSWWSCIKKKRKRESKAKGRAAKNL